MIACPICRGDRSVEFIRRSDVPLLQNRVWPDPASARAAPKGALAMHSCEACGFVWNSAFDRYMDIYDAAYDNDQMQSSHFRDHADAMAQAIIDRLPVGDLNLVEVGCGQGTFISRLVRDGKRHFASLSGFDPAWRGNPVPGVQMYGSYFGPEALSLIEGRADIVVSRHTIEHVPDPLSFLEAIRRSMSDESDARLFLETPDVEWILRNHQFQDFFYEHCSLFSPHSIEVALGFAGFEVVATSRVFGDQYLWTEAKPASVQPMRKRVEGSRSSIEAVRQFSQREAATVEFWRNFVEKNATRDIWIWGASSKGVTFALLVDQQGQWLNGAIDINENKVDRFIPITGLPVAAPDVLCGGEIVIIMNPNYKAEISRNIESMGIGVDVLVLGDLTGDP